MHRLCEEENRYGKSERLNLLTQHIDENQQRIINQRGVLTELGRKSHDAIQAYQLLDRLVAVKDSMERYREQILEFADFNDSPIECTYS